MLVLHVARFATELADFAAHLRTDLASPLADLADHLPQMARGAPHVPRSGPLADALTRTAALLAATREQGAAPARFVSRLEGRLTRLYGIGIGLPTHQQRPRALAPRAARSLRPAHHRPTLRLAAHG